MRFDNLTYDGALFVRPRGKHDIGLISADDRAVSRNLDDIESVEIFQLPRLGCGRAGHAADFRVQGNEVLQRDGAEDATLLLQVESFLGFDRGLKSGGPTAVLRDAPLKLVDQL